MDFPKYDFSDPALQYSTVYETVQRMYSYLNSNKNCCKSSSLSAKLCEVDTILQCIIIDVDDIVRYESDVKSAYLLLYPLV